MSLASIDSQLRTDVELLKKDFTNINELCDRLGATIEKLAEVSNSIGRMLAVHENRLNQQEKESEKVYVEIEKVQRKLTYDIEVLSTKIMEELVHLRDHQQKHYESTLHRVEALENWRWYVMGAAATVGFLIAKLPVVNSFLSG